MYLDLQVFKTFVDPRDRALNRDFSIADDGISPAQQGPKLNEGVQDFTQDQNNKN